MRQDTAAAGDRRVAGLRDPERGLAGIFVGNACVGAGLVVGEIALVRERRRLRRSCVMWSPIAVGDDRVHEDRDRGPGHQHDAGMVAAELRRTVGTAAPGRGRPEGRRGRRAGRVGVDHRQRAVDRFRAGVDHVDDPQADAVERADSAARILADRQVDLLLVRRTAFRIALAADRDASAGRSLSWLPNSGLPLAGVVVLGAVAEVVVRSQPGPGVKPSLRSTNSPGSSVVAGCVQLIGLTIGRQTQGAFGPESTTAPVPGPVDLVEHDRAVVRAGADIGDADREVAAAVFRAALDVGLLLDLEVGLGSFGPGSRDPRE